MTSLSLLPLEPSVAGTAAGLAGAVPVGLGDVPGDVPEFAALLPAEPNGAPVPLASPTMVGGLTTAPGPGIALQEVSGTVDRAHSARPDGGPRRSASAPVSLAFAVTDAGSLQPAAQAVLAEQAPRGSKPIECHEQIAELPADGVQEEASPAEDDTSQAGGGYGYAIQALPPHGKPAPPTHLQPAAPASGEGGGPDQSVRSADLQPNRADVTTAIQREQPNLIKLGHEQGPERPSLLRAAAPAPTIMTVPQGTAPVSQAVQAAAPVASSPRLTLSGEFGERLGIAMARQVKNGREELTIRMDPAELGRIEVKLAFDEHGSLRAVVSTDSATVLDTMRRDLGEITRALADAGVRADTQSFRFERGAGEGASASGGGAGAGGRGSGEQRGHGHPHGGQRRNEAVWERARVRSGTLDLMA